MSSDMNNLQCLHVKDNYGTIIHATDGHNASILGSKADGLHGYLVQIVASDLLALIVIPDDHIAAEAHVIDLTGGHVFATLAEIQARYGVRVSGHKLLRILLVVGDADFVAQRKDDGSRDRMLAHSILHLAIDAEDCARQQLPADIVRVSHFSRLIAKYTIRNVTYKGVFVSVLCLKLFNRLVFCLKTRQLENLNSDRCLVAAVAKGTNIMLR